MLSTFTLTMVVRVNMESKGIYPLEGEGGIRSSWRRRIERPCQINYLRGRIESIQN